MASWTIPVIARPKLRQVAKPPQGGRPRPERPFDLFLSEGESSQAPRGLRPLPSIPHHAVVPLSAPPAYSEQIVATDSTRTIRPLPPTPVQVEFIEQSTAIRPLPSPLLSPSPSIPALVPRSAASLFATQADHPDYLSSAPLLDEERNGEGFNVLFETMKRNPDRHHQLILLASSLSRLALSPQVAQELFPDRSEKGEHRLGDDYDDDDDAVSCPIDFLKDLGPSKRQTVISIINTLVDGDLVFSDGDGDEEDDKEVGEEKVADNIQWEFVRNGAVATSVWRKRFSKRFSRKWEREENGRRVVEDDYRNVIRFLRRI